MTFHLETRRLWLREMGLEDIEFVASMLGDPEVMRFYTRCYSHQEAEGWIRRQMDRYEKDGHGLWLVMDKETARPVGQVGLVLQEVNGIEEPEIGYLIHRLMWRRGFATEAARATRDHAFGSLGKRRLISLIRPENLPSQGVALKLGMQPEGRALHAGREHMIFSLSPPADTPRRA